MNSLNSAYCAGLTAFEKIKRFFGDTREESGLPVGGSIAGVTSIAGAMGVNEIERFYRDYVDSDSVNITAIIANKLANIVCADAEVNVVCKEENELLRQIAEGIDRLGVGGLRGAVAEAFGAGGVVLRPYVSGDRTTVKKEERGKKFPEGNISETEQASENLSAQSSVFRGRVYIERIPQSRFWVLEQCGSEITAGVFLAEIAEIDGADSGFGRMKRVARFEAHRLEVATGQYVIENRAFIVGSGAKEIPLSQVPKWAETAPVSVIHGVSKMLFGFLRSPVEIRGGFEDDFGAGSHGKASAVNVPWEAYGAPVTYGQKAIINMILEILEEIPLEYINKRAFIGADDLLFDSRERLPASGIYKLLRGTGGENSSFWEVFSPEIRHTSYFEGLNYLFGLLEKAISVNKGVLTDLDSSDATATAIKRSTFDTYNLADLMRKNVVRALDDLIYACGVFLREWEGKAVESLDECKVSIDWSYALLEDSTETFSQLMECYKAGIIGKDKLLSFMGIEE